jgi:basic amino acid/polyamine antiporter, APA family
VLLESGCLIRSPKHACFEFLDSTGFLYVANYCSAYISLIVLRRTRPAAARPFRVHGYPVLTLLILAGSLAFLVGAIVSDQRNSVYALLLLLASFPVRRLFRASR